jgi:hypothetical protein
MVHCTADREGGKCNRINGKNKWRDMRHIVVRLKCTDISGPMQIYRVSQKNVTFLQLHGTKLTVLQI